jgi:RHS repeat-associated protein
LASTLGENNPLRYRGYYYDNETGFYYLQSRYYDPTTGRFISPDVLVSTGQGILGHNMYAYCGNNPVNRADDEGEFWHIVVGAVGGAVINGIIQIVSNISSGEEWSSGLATSMLTGAASGALAASGAGLVVSIAGNAAISMAGNFANQVVENKGFNDFDVGDMLIDGVVGGIAGGIGGRGMGKAVNLKTLNSRLTKKMLSGSSKIALKGVKYYLSQTSKLYLDSLVKPVFRASLFTLTYSVGKAFLSQ